MSSDGIENGRLILVGNFLSEAVVAKRGLSDRNPAGSNRMARLAASMKSQGCQVTVLSSAVSWRMKGRAGQLLFRKEREVHGFGEVVYSSAVGKKRIGVLFEPIFYLMAFRELVLTQRPSQILFYSYSPMMLPMLIYSRFIARIPHALDLEDIARPEWGDWKSEVEVRPMQQIVYGAAMKLFLLFTKRLVVPTARFKQYVSKKKKVLVITGCLSSDDFHAPTEDTDSIVHILFGGKLHAEHGLFVFLEAAKLMNQRQHSSLIFHFHICGRGVRGGEIESFIARHALSNVTSHGFVSDEKYKAILSECDVACALQNPNGRFANYKTPSKGYEYMAAGKLLVVTEIGDFAKLPKELCLILESFDGEALAKHLESLDLMRITASKSLAYTYARENFSEAIQGQRLMEFLNTEF